MDALWYAKGRRADLVVLFVALVARLAVLLTSTHAPTFGWPVVDAATYDQAARFLAEGNGLDWRFFWQPFLYPVGLAGIYLVSGGSILVAKIVQLLVGVATCWFALRVARRFLGPGAGLIAGLVCALHGPMIFFETELVATGWATFWAIVLLDRFTRLDGSEGPRSWLLTGALGAIAVLTRPTFLPAVLFATLVLAVRARAWTRLVFAVVAFGVVVAPVAILGARVADHPQVLPASGAMNLYLGNHPEPCETLTVRPGDAWRELMLRAKPAGAGDLVTNREYFREQLIQNLADDPLAVARGIFRKGLQLLGGRELPRNVNPYDQREWSPVLAVLMFKLGGFGFPMGLLIPFAVVGAWVMRRRFPATFFAFAGIYLLGIVAVFVSARYRMPMVPAIAILAAAGMVGVREALKDRAPRRLALMGTALLAVGLVGSVPGPFCEEEVDYRAETLYAVAYAQHGAGKDELAAANYAEALRQRPDYVELLNQYGLLRSQQGRGAEAIDLWTRAVRVDPDHLAIRLNLGRVCTALERHSEALEHFEAALRIDRDNADALVGSGFALLGLARLEEGVDRLVQGVGRNRSYADRLPMVIRALRDRGEVELASRLEDALRRAAARG